MSNHQTEELLPGGSKRVTWKMAGSKAGGEPHEIVIVIAPDGGVTVNGSAVTVNGASPQNKDHAP